MLIVKHRLWMDNQLNELTGPLVTVSYSISSGSTDFILYFGSHFLQGKKLPAPFSPPPFSLWLSHLLHPGRMCESVARAFWNNVKVHKTHRMSVLNTKTTTFQRKLEMSKKWDFIGGGGVGINEETVLTHWLYRADKTNRAMCSHVRYLLPVSCCIKQ